MSYTFWPLITFSLIAFYCIMFFLTSLPDWCLEDEHEIIMLSWCKCQLINNLCLCLLFADISIYTVFTSLCFDFL